LRQYQLPQLITLIQAHYCIFIGSILAIPIPDIVLSYENFKLSLVTANSRCTVW